MSVLRLCALLWFLEPQGYCHAQVLNVLDTGGAGRLLPLQQGSEVLPVLKYSKVLNSQWQTAGPVGPPRCYYKELSRARTGGFPAALKDRSSWQESVTGKDNVPGPVPSLYMLTCAMVGGSHAPQFLSWL